MCYGDLWSNLNEMAVVVSVSVPDELNAKWKNSDLKISPSQIFQIALETQLDGKNKHLQHWSSRALSAEKKLKLFKQVLDANEIDIKKFSYFENT